MFDLETRRGATTKNITVRVPVEVHTRLNMIARERGWIINDMVKAMAVNYISEYEKLPKPKQAKFEFAR